MTRRQRIEDLPTFARPDQPSLSPDGSTVVYVVATVDADGDKNVRSLWRASAAGGAVRQLTRGTTDSAPVWSPDGAAIAFLRAADGAAQLWLLPADGGEPGQLARTPRTTPTPTRPRMRSRCCGSPSSGRSPSSAPSRCTSIR